MFKLLRRVLSSRDRPSREDLETQAQAEIRRAARQAGVGLAPVFPEGSPRQQVRSSNRNVAVGAQVAADPDARVGGAGRARRGCGGA